MSWIRNLQTNKALRMVGKRSMKGKEFGLPRATKRMTVAQLQNKIIIGLYTQTVELNGHETELVAMCQPIPAIKALVRRKGIGLHEGKKLVEEVGARLGVLRREMCPECKGQGSNLKWKGKPPEEDGP